MLWAIRATPSWMTLGSATPTGPCHPTSPTIPPIVSATASGVAGRGVGRTWRLPINTPRGRSTTPTLIPVPPTPTPRAVAPDDSAGVGTGAGEDIAAPGERGRGGGRGGGRSAGGRRPAGLIRRRGGPAAARRAVRGRAGLADQEFGHRPRDRDRHLRRGASPGADHVASTRRHGLGRGGRPEFAGPGAGGGPMGDRPGRRGRASCRGRVGSAGAGAAG